MPARIIKTQNNQQKDVTDKRSHIIVDFDIPHDGFRNADFIEKLGSFIAQFNKNYQSANTKYHIKIDSMITTSKPITYKNKKL